MPMSRRKFIRNLTGGTVGALAAPHGRGESAETSSRRPNILLIMTDQQFGGALGGLAAGELKTRAMDRLIASGTRLTRAYCSQPLCVPSRAGIFTGRYPSEIGVPINQGEYRDAITAPMLGKVMTAGGYETAYFGKWHKAILPEQKDVHGFNTIAAVQGHHNDDKVPDLTRAFLAGERKRPFFAVSSFVNPHDICEWARLHAGLDDSPLPNGDIATPPEPDNCPPPAENQEIPEGEPDVIRWVQRQNDRIYPSVDWDTNDWRQYRWAYHRLIEKVDAQIGEVLDTLARSPHAVNTIVIFTSDHGDGYGAHRWNQKQVLYEESVRVPLVISGPGVPAGQTIDAIANIGLDTFTSCCDWAGIKPPNDLAGLSWKRLLSGRNTGWRSETFIETEFCAWEESWGVTGLACVTDRYKYIAYRDRTRPDYLGEQLFDLANDPGEMNDLRDDPASASALADLRRRLAEWNRGG